MQKCFIPLLPPSSSRHSDEEGDEDPESNSSFWEEPATSKDRKHEEAKPKAANQAHHRGPKRPDKPLYMPRAVRERLSLQNSRQSPGDDILTSPAADSCICRSSEPLVPETTERTESPPAATQERLPGAAECVHTYLSDSPAFGPGEADSGAWESPLLSLAHLTLGNDEKDKEFLPSASCADVTEEVNRSWFSKRQIVASSRKLFTVRPVFLRLRRT